jgi:septum formation protein
VHGGVALVTPEGKLLQRRVMTAVAMKRLSPQELDAYLASKEWDGKAGGYAIQGHAARFVRQIVGSYSNVVGLPLFETATLLEGHGFRW